MTDWVLLNLVLMCLSVQRGGSVPGEVHGPPRTATERLSITKNHTVVRTRFLPKVPPHNASSPLQRCAGGDAQGTGNQTVTLHDGKVYRVVRVRQDNPPGPTAGRCVRRRTAATPMQRRTFSTILGNLTSLIPLRWVTKRKAGERKDGEQADSAASGTHWNLWPSPKHSLGKKQYSYNGEKLKKLLNLFTIVTFDNGGCTHDGLKGTCYHQLECQNKGGRSIGGCAKGFGVCCYIEKTCGQRTSENCTYFVNEGFPQPTTVSPRVCALTVDKAHPGVRQLRIDFQTFELRGPSNGTCLADRFIVTGQNSNDLIPDICGSNTGQHVYVDVDDVKGPLNLNVILMGDSAVFSRTFRLKVTQLRRDDELLAPRNCLQHFTEPVGVIQSFNFQYGGNGSPAQAAPGYFNNLNYAICFRKNRGFCSITYTVDQSQQQGERFQLVNVDQDGELLVPPKQGGAEIFNCPDDYISVNGVRLCGERLNDATLQVDYTKNAPVTDKSNGPFVLPVKTNEAVTGRGFYIGYKQNPCLG